MIKSVTAINDLGESIRMELANPFENGFNIKNIDGLGPAEATINSTTNSTGDGSIVNSARVGDREIVMTIGFLAVPDVESVRQASYRYFPIKRPVSLVIETDRRTVLAYGFVKRNEPTIFTDDESASIAINCPLSYFYDVMERLDVFWASNPKFEFPFSNESLINPLLEFGDITLVTQQDIDYQGDAETGVTVTIHALGPATGVKIFNVTDNQVMAINDAHLQSLTGSGIVMGDTIVINTVKGQKGITLIRNGVTTNILNCLDKGTDWLSLRKGLNRYIYTATTGATNLQVGITNRALYEGV